MLAQILALCAVALLAGCGGGASAPPTASAPPPPDPAPTETIPGNNIPDDIAVSVPPPPPQAWSPVEFTNNSALRTADPVNFQAQKEKFEKLLGYHTARKGFRFGYPAHGNRKIYHLDAINASAAWARGATGKGEFVAITDAGVNQHHPELKGKFKSITTEPRHCHWPRIIFGTGKYRCERYTPYQEHGTAVASLIAAKNLGNRQVASLGVAFQAKLNFRQVSTRHNKTTRAVITDDPGIGQTVLTEAQDREIAEKYFTLRHTNGKGNKAILNQSFTWGGESRTTNGELVRKHLKHTIATMAQKDTPDAEKVIIVRAAGNFGQRSPQLMSALGIFAPELKSHVLAVVATGEDGRIAGISNRCGVAKDFCLAAPGVDLPTAYYDEDYLDHYYFFTGTSAAAPLVSGGLAVLRQYFSEGNGKKRTYQLGNTELVRRLLATANRKDMTSTGGPDYSNSDIYGHGMMDLDAATAPVGALATSLSTDPNAQPFDASAFSLSGNAFGGAMRDALGGVKIAAFDELDAPFFFPLADGVSHAPQISAGHSDTLHEHEVALGGAANASLALSLAAGELSAARIRRGNLWFSYGHHGGREAGLYFGDDGGNPIANFGMNFSDENSAENVANAARHFRAPLAFASPYLSLVRDGPGLGWSQPLRSGARFGFSLMHGAPQF
ncbi:MAG: S8 family serine peptidase, partial [Gammaproteobacteria bacterium]|nr:S8 family serine peptidase [Gammaproteobacteria bacterium]